MPASVKRNTTRFGSRFAYVEGTQAEVFEYRISHEQYCRQALAELKLVQPVPIRCRLGYHSFKIYSVKDGGGCKLEWGYCVRCNKVRTSGWADDHGRAQ